MRALATRQLLVEPFIYVQHTVKVQSEVLTSSGCPHNVGRMSVHLLVDGLGWLCLVQLSFEVTIAAVATQNLNSLLLYSGGSDSKILQTRESWVFHVCSMKLQNKNAYV